MHEHMHTCEYNGCGSRKGQTHYRAGIAGDCVLPSVSTETGTLVLCKNS